MHVFYVRYVMIFVPLKMVPLDLSSRKKTPSVSGIGLGNNVAGVIALVDVVSEACLALHENNIVHSLMMSNHGRNVFLFPR